MKQYLIIKDAFELQANEKTAHSMSSYMRNQFEFYGIPTLKRREQYKTFLKTEKKTKRIDWEFLDLCYQDPHREFQYLVYDYLLAMKSYVVYEDIYKIQQYILTKPWWDTIDFLCRVIGDVSLRDSRVPSLMLDWAKKDDIWLKRTAIQYQLNLKEQTNTQVLEEIIVNCLGTKEFFVNKAIGWALREYSKTNAQWVIEFLQKHQDQMEHLSIREASKYIK